MSHWVAERWSYFGSDIPPPTHTHFPITSGPKGGRGGGLCDTEHGFPAEGKALASFFISNYAKLVSLEGVVGTMIDVSDVAANHRLSRFVRRS